MKNILFFSLIFVLALSSCRKDTEEIIETSTEAPTPEVIQDDPIVVATDPFLEFSIDGEVYNTDVDCIFADATDIGEGISIEAGEHNTPPNISIGFYTEPFGGVGTFTPDHFSYNYSLTTIGDWQINEFRVNDPESITVEITNYSGVQGEFVQGTFNGTANKVYEYLNGSIVDSLMNVPITGSFNVIHQ